MTGSVRLEIALGDDPENMLAGAEASWFAQEVDGAGAVTAVLTAALGAKYEQIREAIRDALPMVEGEIVDELAATQARLFVLHEVMHLPDPTDYVGLSSEMRL